MRRGAYGMVCIALVGACQSAVPKVEEPPALAEFAYAIELQPARGEAVQTLRVPLAVYRAVAREDLGDVRVFDRDGREVPHALRAPSATRAAPARVGVPIFPLYEQVTEGAPVQDVSLHIERSSDGTVIDLRSSAPTESADAGARPAERVVAYVLDLRAAAAAGAVSALQLAFEARANNYISNVALEVSRDLSSWHTIDSGAALARLDYAGQRVEQDRLEFPPTHGPFVRLRARDGQLPGQLEGVQAELVPGEVEPAAEVLQVEGKPLASANEIEFDLGGVLPIRRLTVELAQENTLVQAELESRVSAGASGEPCYSGRLYRLTQRGAELRSAPIELPGLRRRFFKLRVDPRGGGLAGQVPALRVEYVPDQLLFVARGPGPFQLAYGSAHASSTAFSPQQLADSPRDKALLSQTVTLSAPRTMAGARAFAPRPPPPPTKIYALWAVLVVAAATVLVLALRMLRE